MVDGEPGPGAAKAGHDLVADQQDPVAVAQRSDALEVALGRDDHAVGSCNGLEQDGGDRLRAFERNDLLEVREIVTGELIFRYVDAHWVQR